MFSCCRCTTTPKKGAGKKGDKEEASASDEDGSTSSGSNKKNKPNGNDRSQDIIEIRLHDDNDVDGDGDCDNSEKNADEISDKICDEKFKSSPTSSIKKDNVDIPMDAIDGCKDKINVDASLEKDKSSISDENNQINGSANDTESLPSPPTPPPITIQPISPESGALSNRKKSDSSNVTIEETVTIITITSPQPEDDEDRSSEPINGAACTCTNDESGGENTTNNSIQSQTTVIDNSENVDESTGSPQQQDEDDLPSPPPSPPQIIQDETVNGISDVPNQEIVTQVEEDVYDDDNHPDPFECLSRKRSSADTVTSTTINGSGGDAPPKSCISRRSSSKCSIRKKVNINDSTEVIPASSDLASGDDDEVFSDSIPAKLPRGDMCAPYVVKRGSLPGCYDLPEWFTHDERFYYNEYGGILDPPVTPVGKDELALRRHRMYSELLMAAQAAVEHRVRFDPLGPDIASTGGEDCDPDLKPSATAELENLVHRLERLVDRLERSVSARELEIANQTFDTVLSETKRRRSFDLEKTELPPLPASPHTTSSSSETEAATTNPTVKPENANARSKNGATDSCDTTKISVAAIVANAGSAANSASSNSSTSPPSHRISEISEHLDRRIDKLESSLNQINESFKQQSLSAHTGEGNNKSLENSLENIPTTVLDEYLVEDEEDYPAPPTPISLAANMSVAGYQDLVNGPLSKYLQLSSKIGGDVAKHAQLVKKAFEAQLQYVTLATQIAQPQQNKQVELLKPTSDQISAIQEFREKNRASSFFNHLSAISESIPALGWVCVAPTPGPHVKEMNDAGQFYTNRVLKDWKEKNPTHVEWARAWVQTLNDLQQYIKQYHTTGLVWSGRGAAPAAGGTAAPPPPPSAAGMPPPPPPPVLDLASLALNNAAGDERSALFAEINQGQDITKNLKKVTSEMQTHKNTALRTGPAPFKAPQQFGQNPVAASGPVAQADKPPVFVRDGKKWLIEYQKSNNSLLVENAEMNNVVYVFRCQNSTVTVKGKINSVVMDSCKKCSILFDSVVSSVEFVNCQSVQMQVLGKVPTISIDKTDGCQMYLSKDSLSVEIISSKSSEMNVLIPKDNGDYTEQAIPEQYKTTIKGKTLQTICVESVG